MKKHLLLFTFILLGVFGYSQGFTDLIITNNGDSIKCKITLVNDQSIFYDHKVKKSIENTFISFSNVKFYNQEGKTSEINENQKNDYSDTVEYAKNQFEYCEIITTKIPFKNGVEIYADYGKGGGKNYIRGANGKVITFETPISALNYMGKRGWEVVSTYTYKVDVIESIHYLLKKAL